MSEKFLLYKCTGGLTGLIAYLCAGGFAVSIYLHFIWFCDSRVCLEAEMRPNAPKLALLSRTALSTSKPVSHIRRGSQLLCRNSVTSSEKCPNHAVLKIFFASVTDKVPR